MIFLTVVSYPDVLIFTFNLVFSLLPIFQHINYSIFSSPNYSTIDGDNDNNTPNNGHNNGDDDTFKLRKLQLMPISFILNGLVCISYFSLYLVLYLNGSNEIQPYLPSYLVNSLMSLFLFVQNVCLIKSYFQISTTIGTFSTPQQSPPSNRYGIVSPKFIYSYSSTKSLRNESTPTPNLSRTVVTSPISNSHFIFDCDYPQLQQHQQHTSSSFATGKSSNLLTSPFMTIQDNVPPILATLLALSPIPSVNGLPIALTHTTTTPDLLAPQPHIYYDYIVVSLLSLIIMGKLLTLISLISNQVSFSISIKKPLAVESSVLTLALIILNFTTPTISFILLPLPRPPCSTYNLMISLIILLNLCMVILLGNYSMDSPSNSHKADYQNNFDVYAPHHSETIENMGFQASETSRLLVSPGV